MSLILILFLVFVGTIGLALALFYFIVEEPSERRRMRQRLEALEQTSGADAESEEMLLLRESMLSRIPWINRLLLKVRPLIRLQVLVRQAASDMTVARLIGIIGGLWLLSLILSVGFRLPLYLAVLIAFIVASLPLGFLLVRRNRRFSKFEEQFPDAIDLLARAVRGVISESGV